MPRLSAVHACPGLAPLVDHPRVLADPGDVVLFDRRIWHARSRNRSKITRKAVFFGYTYRWVRSRDLVPAD